MPSQIINNIRLVEEQQATYAENIPLGNLPGASQIDSVLSVDARGTLSQNKVRREDLNLRSSILEVIPQMDSSRAALDNLQKISRSLGGPALEHDFLLTEGLQKFFEGARHVKAVSGLDSEYLVKKAQESTNLFNNSLKTIDDSVSRINQDIQATVKKINADFKSLYEINRQILANPQLLRLHDKRDQLLKEISSVLNIKVNSKPAITVSAMDSHPLVSQTGYAQLVFNQNTGNNKYELSIQGFPGKVNSDNLQRTPEYTKNFDNPKEFLEFADDGTLYALIKLKEIRIPEIRSKITDFVKQFAEEVNIIHNSGTPTVATEKLTSQKIVSHRDHIDFDEAFILHPLDSQAMQHFAKNVGYTLPVTIDPANIITENDNDTKPKISDLIKELNYYLAEAPRSRRCAIGEIEIKDSDTDSHVAHLINNISLRSHSNVDATNTSMTFDLEIAGNAYLDFDIAIVDANTIDTHGVVTRFAGNLGDSVNIKKGFSTNTKELITINNVYGGRIELDVNVTSEDGRIYNAKIPFFIGENGQMVKKNDRISFFDDPAGTVLPSGDVEIDHNKVPIAGEFATVSLEGLNNKGTLSPTNTAEGGNLVIKTNNPENILGLTGGHFASKFGFRNFFNYNENTGYLAVNPEIVENNTLLVRNAMETSSQEFVYDPGIKAKITVDFQNLAAGDTITIDEKIFNYSAAPTPGSNEFSSAAGLNQLLSADPAITAKFDIQFNAVDSSFEFIAKNATAADANNDIDAIAVTGALALRDQVRSLPSQKKSILGYRLDKSNDSIMQEFSDLQTAKLSGQQFTLDDIATTIIRDVAEQINKEYSNNSRQLLVLTGLQEEMQDKTGVLNQIAIFLILQELSHLQLVLMKVKVQERKLDEFVIERVQ